MTEPAIEVQRLNKRFGSAVVLDQIHFSVEPGQICALLGPNGAGKTTLLRCLTGAISPSFGRCLIHSEDTALTRHATRLFSYLPDIPPLEDSLRLDEYLRLHSTLRGYTGSTDDVLARVQLIDRKHMLIDKLSRGQRSRLALAECLLHNPPVLILDEPSAGLDPAQVILLRQLLRDLSGDHTILLATHNLAEVEAVCDSLVVLIDGRVRFQGTPTDFAKTFTDNGNIEQAWLALAGAGA